MPGLAAGLSGTPLSPGQRPAEGACGMSTKRDNRLGLPKHGEGGPVPDRIAQLPEPFEGGGFDNGIVERHDTLRRRHGGEELGLKTLCLRQSSG